MSAVQGVNLGGWLVLERWMTPGLFEGTSAKDEHGFVAELGREVAGERLAKHRDSFITEEDFQYIAAQGFDFVRLPVGYWLFEETDNYISGEKYVDKAFSWAKEHGLKVVLDLHALQGSQNGKAHSGQIGEVRFFSDAHITQAVDTVRYVAGRYGSHSSLVGLQLINEPQVRLCFRRLFQYYDGAYQVAERVLRADTKIIISDGFQARRMAASASRRNYDSRLVLDIHLYQVFGKRYKGKTFEWHMDHMRAQKVKLERLSYKLPILIGEWSGSLTGEMNLTPQQQEAYIKLQQEVYGEIAWAQAYWSYKKQTGGAWNARSMIDIGALKPHR